MADLIPGPLEIVGDLMVEIGGGSARVEARGDQIVVELPGLREGASVLGRWPGGRRRAIRRIHEGLTRAGLTLIVNVGSRTVARLGSGARAGLASRLVGLGPLEVRVGALLGSLRGRTDRQER